MENVAQMIVRLPPRQEAQVKEKIVVVEKCCDDSCLPILSSGCEVCYCPQQYGYSTMCNYVGITGLLEGPDSKVCLEFEGQTRGKCVGCQQVCDGPVGMCPFNSGYLSMIPQ